LLTWITERALEDEENFLAASGTKFVFKRKNWRRTTLNANEESSMPSPQNPKRLIGTLRGTRQFENNNSADVTQAALPQMGELM
jgi:hypothetical protein